MAKQSIALLITLTFMLAAPAVWACPGSDAAKQAAAPAAKVTLASTNTIVTKDGLKADVGCKYTAAAYRACKAMGDKAAKDAKCQKVFAKVNTKWHAAVMQKHVACNKTITAYRACKAMGDKAAKDAKCQKVFAKVKAKLDAARAAIAPKKAKKQNQG